MNWIDLIIIAIFVFFLLEARRVGFWAMMADFAALLLSLAVSLRTYVYLSDFLRIHLSISRAYTNAIGFLIIAIVSEAVFANVITRAIRKYIIKDHPQSRVFDYLSAIPAFNETIVIASFFLTLIISLPVSPVVKQAINDSTIGWLLVEKSAVFESNLSDAFGGAVEDSLTYLTVRQDSEESIKIENSELNLSIDETAENDLFRRINQERTKIGLDPLTLREALLPVARGHAYDMWQRGYFGHVSPDGKDVGHRLNDTYVRYYAAGENLALAPTVNAAHNGLMNSSGHRANILSTDFRQMAVGVVDNGYWGKMVVEVFTD